MFVIHYYINKQILDSYLHTKSEKIWLLFTFVLNWVFLRFPWQQQAFWNFQASKPFIHMPYNISIKFHPIPSTLNFSCFCQPQKTWKICIWRSFCTLVTMATAAILKKNLTPPKAATHYGGYSYKVSWSLTKGIQFFLNPLFFVSMATAAKFVQPIPIYLTYLVPLDVDGVPIKFHQFLFSE
jgi:hypothetical protein